MPTNNLNMKTIKIFLAALALLLVACTETTTIETPITPDANTNADTNTNTNSNSDQNPNQNPTPVPDSTQNPTLTPAVPSSLPTKHSLVMSFTSQAPFADWSDLYNEACEEASLIMAEHYITGKGFTKATADAEIVALINWETENGYSYDVNIAQLSEIAKAYYGRNTQVFTGTEVTADKIKELLNQNHPVIIPAAGQLLGNPNFRGDGPPYHMLVIRGYDDKYFYTNDPGTRNGENYKYEKQTLLNAIHDWTGDKSTIQSGQKAMMIVW